MLLEMCHEALYPTSGPVRGRPSSATLHAFSPLTTTLHWRSRAQHQLNMVTKREHWLQQPFERRMSRYAAEKGKTSMDEVDLVSKPTYTTALSSEDVRFIYDFDCLTEKYYFQVDRDIRR